MEGPMGAISLSNFKKLKFVKVLNKLGVVSIMQNKSQTPTFWSTNYLALDFKSFILNNSNVLAPIFIVINTI